MDDGNQIQSAGVVPCRTTKALNKDVDVVVGALLIIKGCSFHLLITWSPGVVFYFLTFPTDM